MVRRGICTCLLDTDEHPNGEPFLEDVANMRLIAAAPALLEACRAALSAINEEVAAGNDGPGQTHPIIKAHAEVAKQCESAIRAAQGEGEV